MSALSLISKLIPEKVITKGMDTFIKAKTIKNVDKTQEENNIHGETVEMLKAYAAEMGKESRGVLGSIKDLITGSVRPIIAYIVIAMFLICMAYPEYAIKMTAAFRLIPTELWVILGQVILFYFGGRMLKDKFNANRPTLSPQQQKQLMDNIKGVETKVNDNQLAMIDATKKQTEAIKSMVDKDGDGLDDRGVNHIKLSEGWRDKMYKCPANKLTIGYGFNLEAIKMPKAVGELWISILVKDVIKSLKSKYNFIDKLDKVRYWVVVDMAYNLGVNNTKTLYKTMIALENEIKKKKPNYKKVAKVMKSGKWYKQVGRRSKALVNRMTTGKWV
jgi:lysozyme